MADMLPALFALFGVFATVAANIVLGIIKNKSDTLIAEDNIEGEFQERLITAFNAQQIQIDKLIERVHKLEEEIDLKRTQIHTLYEEKYELEHDLKVAKNTLKEKEDYIARMESKIWYTPSKDDIMVRDTPPRGMPKDTSTDGINSKE